LERFDEVVDKATAAALCDHNLHRRYASKGRNYGTDHRVNAAKPGFFFAKAFRENFDYKLS